MLSDAVDILRTKLVAAGVTAPLYLGKRHLAQKGNAGPSGAGRIVAIPGGLGSEAYGPGKTQGFNDRPKQLLTRGSMADLHIWCPPDPLAEDKDRDAMRRVEELLHVVVREWRTINMGQGHNPVGGWNNDLPETHVYGAEYVLTVAVDIPVTAKRNAAVGPATPTLTTDTGFTPPEAP